MGLLFGEIHPKQTKSLFLCKKNMLLNNEKYAKSEDRHKIDKRYKTNVLVPFHRAKKTQNNSVYWGIKYYNQMENDIKKLPPTLFSKK